MEVLLEQGEFTYDAEGRESSRTLRVFRVLTPAGVTGWQEFGASWKQVHSERPGLRARVVTPDGRSLELDPATVADAGAAAQSSDQFDDTRVLRAPLPGLVVGAVVVEERVQREHTPYFRGGRGGAWAFQLDVPVRRTRLVLRAPKKRALLWRAQRAAVTPLSSIEGEVAVLTFEGGATAALESLPPGLPPDAEGWPAVAWSTGESWRDLARGYGELIAPALKGPVPDAAYREAVGDAKGRDAVIRRVAAYVQEKVRYTAINLGDGGIVPRLPEQVIGRGYGDCKDKATLMVAMLARAGIAAHVALVAPGRGTDLLTALPKLSAFSHAIVVVPGKPALWIDGTVRDVPVGALPTGDQGRLALIVAPDTKAPVLTPVTQATDNTKLSRRVLRMSRNGAPTLSFDTQWTGASAAGMREYCRDTATDKRNEYYAGDLASNFYSATLDGDVSCEVPEDLSAPVRVRYAAQAPQLVSEEVIGLAEVYLILDGMTDWLPDSWAAVPAKGAKGDAAREALAAWTGRPEDAVIEIPHRTEIQYRVEAPSGFQPHDLPETRRIAIGKGYIEERYVADPAGGAVEASFVLDSGPARMTAAEARGFIDGLHGWLAEPMAKVQFAYRPIELEGQGKLVEAVAAYRALNERDPDNAHLSGLVNLLLRVGLTEVAREEAAKGVSQRPETAEAHFVLALSLSAGAYGVDYAPGADLPRAAAAYREAIKLNPAWEDPRLNLGLLLARGPEGVVFSPLADLRGAVAVWNAAPEGAERAELTARVITALVADGGAREALAIDVGPAPVDLTRHAHLAAKAVVEGVEAANALAARWFRESATRRTALDTAAAFAINGRHYSTAAALMRSGPDAAGDSTRQAQISAIGRAKRWDPKTLDPSQPCSPMTALMAGSVDPTDSEASTEGLLGWFASPTRAHYRKSKPEIWFSKDALRALVRRGVSAPVGVDLATSLSRCEVVDTRGPATRIRVTMADGRTSTLEPWVVLEHGAFRIVGHESPASLGWMIRDAVDRSDLEGARAWATIARERLAESDDRLTPSATVLAWPRGERLTADQLRLAANLLIIPLDAAQAEAQAAALEAEAQAATEPRRRAALSVLQAAKLGSREPSDARLAIWRSLASLFPGDPSVGIEVAYEHLRAKRHADAEAAAAKVMAMPGHESYDEDCRSVILATRLARTDDAGAAKLLVDQASKPDATSSHLNDGAWALAAEPDPDPRTAAWALRANQLSGFAKPSILDTLALVQAEQGDIAQALIYARTVVELTGAPYPTSDAIITGRLAEVYGYTDHARTAYAKALALEDADGTIRAIATRRLAALR